MRRRYVQDNVTIENPLADYGPYDALSESMCQAQKTNFSETYSPAGDHRSNYNSTGRLRGVGEALRKGAPARSPALTVHFVLLSILCTSESVYFPLLASKYYDRIYTIEGHPTTRLPRTSSPRVRHAHRHDARVRPRGGLRQQHVAPRLSLAQERPVGRSQEAVGRSPRPV